MLYRASLNKLSPGLEEYRGGGGYFYEYSTKTLDDIVPAVNGKFQTVTYFGVNPEEIRTVVIRNRLTGIDRIMSIGREIDIGVIWDGYDLFRMLSRLINVE